MRLPDAVLPRNDWRSEYPFGPVAVPEIRKFAFALSPVRIPYTSVFVNTSKEVPGVVVPIPMAPLEAITTAGLVLAFTKKACLHPACPAIYSI